LHLENIFRASSFLIINLHIIQNSRVCDGRLLMHSAVTRTLQQGRRRAMIDYSMCRSFIGRRCEKLSAIQRHSGSMQLRVTPTILLSGADAANCARHGDLDIIPDRYLAPVLAPKMCCLYTVYAVHTESNIYVVVVMCRGNRISSVSLLLRSGRLSSIRRHFECNYSRPLYLGTIVETPSITLDF